MTRPDRRSPSLFSLGSWPQARRTEHVTVAVLAGSLVAAALASVALRIRNRTYRTARTAEQASADENADDIPDVFQRRTRA